MGKTPQDSGEDDATRLVFDLDIDSDLVIIKLVGMDMDEDPPPFVSNPADGNTATCLVLGTTLSVCHLRGFAEELLCSKIIVLGPCHRGEYKRLGVVTVQTTLLPFHSATN